MENAQAPTAEPSSRVSLQQLMTPQAAAQVVPGYGSAIAFDLLQRQAKALASSTLVPTAYQSLVIKYDRDGNVKERYENPQAIPNTMIALNMAVRMNADPIMVMQNLYIVEGRPSWSSQWVIAQINNCGRFEPLRFDLVEKGTLHTERKYVEWIDDPVRANKRKPIDKVEKLTVENIECIAWTVPKGTKIPVGVVTYEQAKAAGLPVLKSPKVSVDMAVKEGWYTKNGSKWQTIPELMLHYRSGAFFGRLYAPELLMGFQTQEEAEDIAAAAILRAMGDGTYAPEPAAAPAAAAPAPAPTPESLRRRATDTAQDAEPKSGPTTTAPAADPASTSKDATGAIVGEGSEATMSTDAPAATPAPAAPEKPTAPVATDDMFGKVD